MNVNQKPRTVNHFFVEMVSFHELQELFLFSHAQGNLDDEELLLLYEEYSPKNPDFCYENFGRFSLDDVNDAECLAEIQEARPITPCRSPSNTVQLYVRTKNRIKWNGSALYSSDKVVLPLQIQ